MPWDMYHMAAMKLQRRMAADADKLCSSLNTNRLSTISAASLPTQATSCVSKDSLCKQQPLTIIFFCNVLNAEHAIFDGFVSTEKAAVQKSRL